MKNRNTPFGYGIACGQIVILPEEAEIVQNIFSAYLSGKSLKALAEELTSKQISYLPGKWQWNKNRIARLLGDSRYLGWDEFPEIVSEEIYLLAEQKRQAQTEHKHPVFPEVINEAVIPIYCGKCGAKTKRIRKAQGQKRLCTNPNCRQGYPIPDARFSEILTNLLRNAEVGETAVAPDAYSQELHRMENDLVRRLDMVQPDGEQLRTLIFQIAAKKYQIASYGKHISEKLRTDLQRAALSDFITRRQVMEMVQSITILSEEEMEVTLVNGQIVRKEPCHGESGKDRS